MQVVNQTTGLNSYNNIVEAGTANLIVQSSAAGPASSYAVYTPDAGLLTSGAWPAQTGIVIASNVAGHATGSSTTPFAASLPLTPSSTPAVGDMLLFAFGHGGFGPGASATPGSVTGGNVSTWNLLYTSANVQ